MGINIKYLPKRPKVMPVKSPYDLVDLVVNSKPVQARPVAWDCEIVDHYNLLGPAGRQLVVTKVIAMCPDCMAGVEFEVPPTEHSCPHCNTAPELPVDPFRNPFPLLDAETVNTDLFHLLEEAPDGTVADRLELDQ
jgi:hypothetical protein